MDPIHAKIGAEIRFLEARLANAREYQRKLQADDLPKFIKWVVAGSEVYRLAGDQNLEAAEKALADAMIQLYYHANKISSRPNATLERAKRFVEEADAYLDRVYAYRSKEALESIPAAEEGITGTKLGALGAGTIAVCTFLGPGAVLAAGAAACAILSGGKEENPRRKAEQYRIEGDIYFDRGNWRAALELYEKSLELLGDVSDQPIKAMTHMRIGHLYQSKSQWTKALDHYRKSLAIKEKLRNDAGVASTHNSIGIVYQLAGKLPEALEAFQESLVVAKQERDLHGQARAYVNIGNIHRLQGDRSRAIEFHEKGLDIVKQIDDPLWKADIYDSLGNTFYLDGNHESAQGKPESAEKKFEEARLKYKASFATRRDFGDQNGMAIALGNIGKVLQRQGKLGEALGYYDWGLRIIVEIGKPRRKAKAYHNVGEAYYAHGKFNQESFVNAEELFNKSLAISDQLGDDDEMAKTLYWMGLTAIKMGKMAEARQDLNRALEFARKVRDEEIATAIQEALNNLEER